MDRRFPVFLPQFSVQMFEQIEASLARCLPLSEPDWRTFRSCLTRKRFGRRQGLATPGENPACELFVEQGCLRVYCTTDDGLDRNLLFAPEESWISHGLMQASEPHALVGIDAVEDSEVLMIDNAAKERLCTGTPRFERLFRLLAERSLELLQQRLILSMQHTAEGRYLEFKRHYPQLDRRLPQYHVAGYLGISPEFLSKIKKRH
ncbi:MAG: Crp/Fnr family transcriptional regulator [Vicinamibacterales bacterium]|nr:Crp/Fnr family transcriptional regulator [Vicinamibacterales bacterium]